jgi:iron complex transport system substrate-binding protein
MRTRAAGAVLLMAVASAGCGDGGGDAYRNDRAAPGAASDPTGGVGASAVGAVFATDAAGRSVRLDRPARRLVSLLPAATEMLFALGAGDRVVGRTRYDTDPHLEHLPSVGGGLDASPEALVALEPDLVLAWEAPGGSGLRERLEALGIPVFAIAIRDTADVYRGVRDLGLLLSLEPAADSLATRMRAGLDSVRAAVPSGPRPSVLYVISTDPPIIAGTDNYLAELIEVAGGEPVAISAEVRGGSPQVSIEALLVRQPDVLIVPIGAGGGGYADRLRREPGWRDLEAVREGRVSEVPADLVHRPGPRMPEVARVLREAIAAAVAGKGPGGDR